MDEGFSPQRHYDTTVIWTADFADIIATSDEQRATGNQQWQLGGGFTIPITIGNGGYRDKLRNDGSR